MASPRIVPALARATQDIAGPLPAALLREWSRSDRTPEAARSILAPFGREGFVVSSDGAGLSKMSLERDLVDVLAMISAPKRVVHAVVTAAGGRAIGTWIADNTESFFPATFSPATVVDTAWEVQVRVAAAGLVPLGISIHRGHFYEVSGGMYGPDADVVELVAEEHTVGGEVVVSRAVADALGGEAYQFSRRKDLDWLHEPGFFRVERAQGAPSLVAGSGRYPHPFTDEFVDALSHLEDAERWPAIRESIERTQVFDRAVLFVVRRPGARGAPSLHEMLDELATDAWMDMAVWRVCEPKNAVVELGGGLGILVFESTATALEVAYRIRDLFAENDVEASYGIDRGAVLLFEDGRGGWRRVAGSPVNIASKISEDLGEAGRIRVTSRAVATLPNPPAGDDFEATVSRVRIEGVVL